MYGLVYFWLLRSIFEFPSPQLKFLKFENLCCPLPRERAMTRFCYLENPFGVRVSPTSRNIGLAYQQPTSNIGRAQYLNHRFAKCANVYLVRSKEF